MAEPELPEATFKRVDAWRFVDLDLPATPAERQLKRHSERVFSGAQYSREYTCLAREYGNYYEKYGARPEESLGLRMMGRCGAPAVGASHSRVYFSDGTILDSPLSDALLNDISTRFSEVLEPFTVFGVSARYDGPNMLVTVDTASPDATIDIAEADADRNVLVSGTIFGAFDRASALINQGQAGSAFCEEDQNAPWPKYAFTCQMAPGDEEAWVSVSASTRPQGWWTPLVSLPAHTAGWVPPAEFRRGRRDLPKQVDTRTGLVTAINSLRLELGTTPLHFSAQQSAFIQPVYERAFKLNARGDWLGDQPYRVQMLRGDRIGAAVVGAEIASGIAFDGDVADWLDYSLLFPIRRRTLMAKEFDVMAIAVRGAPTVGFGAAVLVYRLLTEERQGELEDVLAASIAEVRKGRSTQRIESPPELVATALEIAQGTQPIQALSATLRRLNLSSRESKYMAGLFIPLDDGPPLSPTAPLRDARTLTYGIVMTHVTDPSCGWARPVAFVWFFTERPLQQEASRGTPSVPPN